MVFVLLFFLFCSNISFLKSEEKVLNIQLVECYENKNVKLYTIKNSIPTIAKHAQQEIKKDKVITSKAKTPVEISQELHKEFNEYMGPLTLLDRYEIVSASYRFSNIHRNYEGGKTGQSSGIALIKF